MFETFAKAFFLIFLMEIFSSSQVMLAMLSAHSHWPWLTWTGGVAALLTTCLIATNAGVWVAQSNFPLNLVSGIILITTGVLILWKG